MRKLIVTVISTLDGYAAGEGGDVFVMPIDLGFDRYNLERMRAADTMLFGAASFLGARNYWPPLADDDSARRSSVRSRGSTTLWPRWSSPTASHPRTPPRGLRAPRSFAAAGRTPGSPS